MPSSFRLWSFVGVQAPSQVLRYTDSPAPSPRRFSQGVRTPETPLGVTGCPSGTLPSCLSFLRQAPPPQAPPPSLPTRGQGDPDAGIPGKEARRLLPGAHSSAPPAAPGAAAAPPPARWLQGRPVAHRLLAAQAPEGQGRGRGRGGARRRRRGRGNPAFHTRAETSEARPG